MINNADSISQFWKKKQSLSYVLAVFVFLIHISSLYNYPDLHLVNPVHKIVDSLTVLAVPLFFILSAATFYRNYTHGSYKKKIKTRSKTLLAPYLAWNVIALLFDIGVTLFLSKYIIGRDLFDFRPISFFLAIFYHLCNFQFWFIFCLIVYTLISPLIWELLKRKYIGIIVILAYTLCVGFTDFGNYRIFGSLIYYLVGAFIGIHCFSAICRDESILVGVVFLRLL